MDCVYSVTFALYDCVTSLPNRTSLARCTSTRRRSQLGTLAPCSPLKCIFMTSTVSDVDTDSRKMVIPKN